MSFDDEPFGFKVRAWDIAGEEEEEYGAPHARAVALFEEFIAQAQAALAALRAGSEHPEAAQQTERRS